MAELAKLKVVIDVCKQCVTEKEMGVYRSEVRVNGESVGNLLLSRKELYALKSGHFWIDMKQEKGIRL